MKLTKAERDRRVYLGMRLGQAQERLRIAIAKFNETVAAAYEDVENEADHFDEAVQEAAAFAEDIGSSQREVLDSRSDSWIDKHGENAEAFVGAWEGFVPSPVDLPDLYQMDLPVEIEEESEDNIRNCFLELPVGMD